MKHPRLQNHNNYHTLVFDAAYSLFTAFVTLWLLEAIKPGIVSSYVDLGILLLILIIVFIVAIFVGDKEAALSRGQKKYFTVFFIFDFCLLLYYLSLQFSRPLLILISGVLISIIIGSLFFKYHD